ncbi:MAG: hypothetical protein J0I93_00055 [Legionella sp.]|nr:hypothetical protein [Legionella sp.]
MQARAEKSLHLLEFEKPEIITQLNANNPDRTNLDLRDLGQYWYTTNTLIKFQVLAQVLIKNTVLTRFSLGGVKIHPKAVEYLANVLLKNNTLIELDCSDCEFDTKELQHLAHSLRTNTSLNKLNLSNNDIESAGISVLADILKNNTGLTEILIYENNKINDTDMKVLMEALKDNYTLLNLGRDEKTNHSQYHKVIGRFLHRNKLIADCLKPLTDSLISGDLLTDAKVIEDCLQALSKILPRLHKLPENSYPQEAYRVLTYLKQQSAPSDKDGLKVLPYLSHPFKHRPFQMLVDQKLVMLLVTGTLSDDLQEYNVAREERLLTLGLLHDSLHKLEMKTFATMALFNLLHPDQVYTMQAHEVFDTRTVLLSEHELRQLVQSALATPSKKGETVLLEQLLNAPRDLVGLLTAACSSPAFLNTLKIKYPQAQAVTTIAHCLWANHNQSPLTLAIPNEPQWQPDAGVALELELTIEHFITELKASLASALRAIPVPAPDDESDFDLDEPVSPVTYTESEQKYCDDTVDAPNHNTLIREEVDHDKLEPHVLGNNYAPQPETQAQENELPTNEDQALIKFREAYARKLSADKRTFFGFFRRSNLNIDNPNLGLNDIFRHALHGGNRSRSVLIQLGWLDKQGNIQPSIRALLPSKDSVQQDLSSKQR